MTTEAEGSGGVLKLLADALPITLIHTPLGALTTCGQGDRVEDVIRDTRKPDYDYVPVIRRENQDEIIGLLKTSPCRTGTVKDALEPLSEPLLIGGDASILDFVQQADSQPCRLVLAGTRICGLVTLSDLQKLPARAALFGLVTDLELVLQEIIGQAFDRPSDWKQKLSDGRREILARKVRRASSGGLLLDDEVLYTELCDKLDIVRELPGVELSNTQRERLVEFRHKLAHANVFADSAESAQRTCEAVRNALALRQSLVS